MARRDRRRQGRASVPAGSVTVWVAFGLASIIAVLIWLND